MDDAAPVVEAVHDSSVRERNPPSVAVTHASRALNLKARVAQRCGDHVLVHPTISRLTIDHADTNCLPADQQDR